MTASDSLPTTLRRRALRKLLLNALIDWRSLTVLALAGVLFLLRGNTWVFIGGLALWLLISLSVLFNWSRGERVVAEMLSIRFEPRAIRHSDMRRRIRKALEYRSSIEAVVQRTGEGLLRDTLAQTAQEVDDWLANIYSMAQRLDGFYRDRTIQHDLQRVPLEIDKYRRQLKKIDDDETLRQQTQRLLDAKQRQWESLKTLKDAMERAKLYMDNTQAALGTVYSQILLINAKDIESGRARRLRKDISEEIKGLQDVLSAMDEVYQNAP